MGMNRNFFAFVVGVVLAVVLGRWYMTMVNENRELKSQVSQLQVSLAHATLPIEYYTIRDSVTVARQEIVTIDKTDYKQQAADKQLIKDLQLRVDQVESENQMLRRIKDTVRLEIDSVATSQDTILRYRDKWADFAYHVRNSQLAYSIRDSLTTYVAKRYKHRFLWWRWGTKGYDIVIVNHNPHATVEYNKYLMKK